MTDPDDRDMLAAEYALGTLDASERTAFDARLAVDMSLMRAVRDWEDRLSPLSELTPAVPPPSALFQGIERRLFGPSARGVPRALRRWQAATGVCAALAAALIAWIAISGLPGSPRDTRLVAVLQRDPAAPAMVLDVDLRSRRLTVRSVASSTPAGKSYELWMIEPAAGAPRSLGVVPPHAAGEASLVTYDPTTISEATYAVTLEPAGGSPDGRPSGTPIISGKLVAPLR